MTAAEARKKSTFMNNMEKDSKYADIIYAIDKAAGIGDYHALFYEPIPEDIGQKLLDDKFKIGPANIEGEDNAVKISW